MWLCLCRRRRRHGHRLKCSALWLCLGQRRRRRQKAQLQVHCVCVFVGGGAISETKSGFLSPKCFSRKIRFWSESTKHFAKQLFAQRSFPLFAQGSFPFSRQGSFHISFFRCAHFATATPALFNSQKQQGSSSLLTNSQQARRGASRVATMTSFFVFRGVQKPQGHQGGHHFRPPWCVCGFCSNEKVFILLLQRTTQTPGRASSLSSLASLWFL